MLILVLHKYMLLTLIPVYTHFSSFLVLSHSPTQTHIQLLSNYHKSAEKQQFVDGGNYDESSLLSTATSITEADSQASKQPSSQPAGIRFAYNWRERERIQEKKEDK